MAVPTVNCGFAPTLRWPGPLALSAWQRQPLHAVTVVSCGDNEAAIIHWPAPN